MRTILVLFALSLTACSFTIGEVDPRPNVLLGPAQGQLALRFATEVPEAMPVDVQAAPLIVNADVSVTRWHETLSRGFHNGFDRYFAKTGPTSTLEMLRAMPAVYAGARTGSVSIRYQAQLVDEKGSFLRRFAGTAVSPIPLTNALDLNYVMQGAVESLYEQIAAQLPPTSP